MQCPLCHGRIGFAEGATSSLLARAHCSKCATTFRITAPGQTALMAGVLAVFCVAAVVLGVVFFADFWSGIIGIVCLILLLVLLEFLTYRYYSKHGQLHQVAG